MNSRTRKPYGAGNDKPPRELSRLKLLWQKSLSDTEKTYWRDRLYASVTMAKLREEILERWQIKLDYDSQLLAFRRWDERECEAEFERELQQDEEQRLAEEFGGPCGLPRMRQEVLRRYYQRVLATGDFKQGLSIAREHRNIKKLAIDTRKIRLREIKLQQSSEHATHSASDSRPPLTLASGVSSLDTPPNGLA